jgi:hypothetical protein
MAGIGRVVRSVAQRKGARAFEAAGRPPERITLYGELADHLADRLAEEGHELAFTARQVVDAVREHERARLAQRG